VGPEVVSRDAAGHLDVDGGLHPSAHGHEVGCEADLHVRPSSLAQPLHHQAHPEYAIWSMPLISAEQWIWQHVLSEPF